MHLLKPFPILVIITTALASLNAKPFHQRNILKFIGHTQAPNGQTLKQTSSYFMSNNSVPYTFVEEECKAALGINGTLVYIETQEELANITKLLSQNVAYQGSYWLGGRYDSEKSSFAWFNGIILGPWSPWDDGYPDATTSLTRVMLNFQTQSKFSTHVNTESSKYLCELKTGSSVVVPDPCYNDNDLVVVVDSSGSISAEEYTVALEFTARLAAAWADSPQNRLAVIIFSSTNSIILNLTDRLTITQVRDKIYKATHLNDNTNSAAALTTALNHFKQNSRSVPRNLVFLTDGASDSATATVTAANAVKAEGIRAFSVGIGVTSTAGKAELLAIAGGTQARVFNTDGFNELLQVLQPLSRSVCEL